MGWTAPLYFPVDIGPEIDHKTDCAGVEVAAVETRMSAEEDNWREAQIEVDGRAFITSRP